MSLRHRKYVNVGWHALRYSEGRGSGKKPRPSEYLRACHPKLSPPFESREQLFDLELRGNLALFLGAAKNALEVLDRRPAGELGDGAHHVDEQDAIEMVDFMLP